MTKSERSTTVEAAPDRVWSLLADFGGIARWADNVDHSCLLDERVVGVGSVRRIQTGRATLLERVVAWDPPRALAYEIEGLPPVVRSATNEWRLAPAGGGGTVVTLTSDVVVGTRPPQELVAKALSRRLARESDIMLAGLTAAVEGANRA